VLKAFELLNSDKQVKAIFVNIFRGIVRFYDFCSITTNNKNDVFLAITHIKTARCDVITMGIINAAHAKGMKKPSSFGSREEVNLKRKNLLR